MIKTGTITLFLLIAIVGQAGADVLWAPQEPVTTYYIPIRTRTFIVPPVRPVDNKVYIIETPPSARYLAPAPRVQSVIRPEIVVRSESLVRPEIVIQPEIVVRPKTVIQPETTIRQETASRQDSSSGAYVTYMATIRAYYGVDVVTPPAYSISYAQCTFHTDDSIQLQFFYTDNTTSEYRISNPIFRGRENPSLFKTTYNTVQRNGPEMIFGPLICDVYSNGQEVHQIVLYGKNRSSITINLRKN